MVEWQLKTPVCLIIFRRPEVTQQVFEAIRQVKPPQLLVIADGPRQDKPGETELCAATRQIIETVDWDCEVLKNYSDVNLGLKHRVASGLDWVFETVEEAIVLEDDCLPDPSFFRFCEELLGYYRYQEKVMVITGTNFLFGWKSNQYSYYFTRYIDCWGWATWRRAWQHFDFEMKEWPTLRDQNWLQELLPEQQAVEQWIRIFQGTYEGLINSWAFRWMFACWKQQGLTIVPEKNLVSNIGFNQDSTNTVNVDTLLASTPIESLNFPLKHSSLVAVDSEVDEFIQKIVFSRDLSYLSAKISNVWLKLDAEELKNSYQQDKIKRILFSARFNKSNSEPQSTIVKEIINNMSKTLENTQKIQNLLVAMLYTYPHQLPLPYEFSEIPQWLRNNYLKFSFEVPKLFTEIGEIERYSSYLQRWVNTIHNNLSLDPNSEMWQYAALAFLQNSNFKPLCLTKANLKQIYSKRAKLIELILQIQGYQLECDFSVRLPERDKIRLGILAQNFGIQPETFTSLPIYKFLNRDQFEIVLYSTEAIGDRLERYCSGHADAAVQLPDDLATQVQTIRGDDLDILFIASNITAEVNPITLLASHRLARVQVIGMNCPVTSGMTNIDYYISGNLVEPEDSQKNYTETLVQLNSVGISLDWGTEGNVLSNLTVNRTSLGIPEDSIVYISGASFDLITPEVQKSWIEIIKTVPNSVLLLYSEDNTSSLLPQLLKENFEKLLIEEDLEVNRILFCSVENHADIQEFLNLSDIYLDVFPYSSGLLSLIQPLQIGLPTVVLEGDVQRSRLGSSLLRELQIEEVITNTETTYIQLAITLGTQPTLQQKIRDQIQNPLTNSNINSPSYGQQIQNLWHNLFCDYLKNSLIKNLRLRETNLIIFPDWNQSEDAIYSDFSRILSMLMSDSNPDKITLLVDITNINDEDADMTISAMVMNLMMETELDIEQGLDISLIGKLSQLEWKVLLTQVQARIELEYENKEAIVTRKAQFLPLYDL